MMQSLGHLWVFACNLAIFAVLGWVTRGFVLRLMGWAFLSMAVFFWFVGIFAGDLIGYVIGSSLPLMVGLTLWTAGHWMYARAHGRWKSLNARDLTRFVCRRVERFARRRDAAAKAVVSS